MGLFDNILGGQQKSESRTSSSSEDLSSGPAGSEFSADAGRSSSVSTGEDFELYNPYRGLRTALDGRGEAPRTAFKVPQRPEFVFKEEDSFRRRNWTENITYYTGVGYLAGAGVGGGLGTAEALRRPPAGGEGSAQLNARLKLNRLLNTSGAAGRMYGNSAGVVGLYFAASESLLFHYLDRFGLPDALPTLGAGFATGALYRIPRGPRTAAVAGLVGTACAGLLLAGRSVVSGL
uniref:Mitochondrial import inner membrane translocase subunit TIM23 n=1 Tax=Tetraselmis sp. GSL018 TaxID=582737 RepID=A0A061QSZ4_9CHLO|mmetsp:Transcript_6103/g.14762  ORF Transcript_6103/g.14762 Transcript_6103/m.14762 type:complete len:234 (+) Transcript_6103:106-807(+)